MNADYVENIIRNIDKQSYKCILVDGAWGIGKSYMVRKALEDMKDRTCFISLFGMDDVQKIYHEAFFQLALRTSRGGKIANGAKGVAKAAGNFCAEITKLNGALAQAISERELFAVTASNFKKNRIIVIDDLERRKAGLDLEELFGVIEELKQSNYIKVILIANSNEIHENERTTFNKYKEKTIDRIFEVTEHSASIKWGVYGIDGEFIDAFLMHHKAKNLRTLQKAQNFYNDVKQYCLKIENEQFMNEVKMLCFAVVVEDVDKLYYKNDSTEKENTNSRYRKDGHKRFRNNIFEKVSVFTEERQNKGDIRVLGVCKNKRVWMYIPEKYVETEHENLKNWKVLVARVNGSGNLGEALSTPVIEAPNEGYTQTFIGIGSFKVETEAQNALKYIKSKFCRTMLGILKITQDNNRDTWRMVPLQDFTAHSDIDWSKSVTEIDQQLYRKYDLTADEIEFIETHVKEMA